MFLNRFHVRSLISTPRYDRRLAGRGYDLGRNNVAQTFIAFFGHGFERVIEFVFLNVNALLPGLLKLLKYLLGLVDPARVTFQFHPAFAGRHFDA
jgi:hypothetical protein